MKEKILVVDDEKPVCEMLKRFLTKRGYNAACVSSGEAALEKIKKDKPQVVLLDIRMPKMDGIEVLKKIKEFDQTIGVVMITAVKDDEVGMECLKMGAFDYITKPLGLKYLENVLMVKLLNFDKFDKK